MRRGSLPEVARFAHGHSILAATTTPDHLNVIRDSALHTAYPKR
jgi:hypothetical protein